jgi:hypothetical protein
MEQIRGEGNEGSLGETRLWMTRSRLFSFAVHAAFAVLLALSGSPAIAGSVSSSAGFSSSDSPAPTQGSDAPGGGTATAAAAGNANAGVATSYDASSTEGADHASTTTRAVIALVGVLVLGLGAAVVRLSMPRNQDPNRGAAKV